MANEEIDQDEVLKIIDGLRKEAKSAFASFEKKLASGALADPTALATEVSNLFSLVVDIGEQTLSLHTEHMEWSEDIEAEIDALKEGVSSLLPSDAVALKTTLLALQHNLRAATGPDDTELERLNTKVAETLTFIDAITMSDEDDEEEDETPDDADDED